uniref:Uncharacterized protein n=1 Tax=Amphimedon queenslandica TaxID=400682 RepID=A0A1X7UNM0_AMPQE
MHAQWHMATNLANDVTLVNSLNWEFSKLPHIIHVGETYGRKMMKGYLASKRICINEKKVADSLCRVAPQSYERRRHSIIDTTNPVPYHTSRFGHKLHLDQNEKLVMFGVTHVLGVNGDAVLKYGLWEQIRVDCGAEFFLTLYIQEKLQSQYGSTDIVPFVQTPSTQ